MVGKHTERTDITTRNQVMQCLVEAYVSDAPHACHLVGGLFPLRNEYAAVYLDDATAMGVSVCCDGPPIATSTSPTTSEIERQECNWDATAHLITELKRRTQHATDATHKIEIATARKYAGT